MCLQSVVLPLCPVFMLALTHPVTFEGHLPLQILTFDASAEARSTKGSKNVLHSSVNPNPEGDYNLCGLLRNETIQRE